jgi:signal transduction histidine kinase
MRKTLCCLCVFIANYFTINECFSQSKGTEPLFFYQKKIDSLKILKPSFSRDTTLIYFYHKLIIAHSVTDVNLEKYQSEYIELENLVKKTDWLRGKALYKLHLAGHKIYRKKEVEGIGLYLEAEKELEKAGDIHTQIFALSRIIAILGNNTTSLSAEPFILKNLRLAKSTKNLYAIESALNAAGDFYMNRQKWAKALPYFVENDKNRKQRKKTPLNDESFRINAWVNQLNIGMCYLNLNNEKEGLANVLNVLNTMPHNINFARGLHKQVRYDLVVYFIEKKKYDEAEKYLRQIENLSPIIGRPDLNDNLRLQKFYFEINKGRANYVEAIKNLERYQAFNDTLINNETQNKIDGFKSQLKLQEETEKRKMTDLKNLKIENERQNQLRWLFLALSIIGLVTTIYIFRTNKKLKKNNQELLEKNAEISAALLKGQTLERKRVAADLHDSLGSTMSSLIYTVNAIDTNNLDKEEKTVYGHLKQMLDTAYNEIRLLSHNLLPEEFEKQGLAEALRHFVRKINQTKTIQFDLSIDPKLGRLSPKTEFELYSICLELINNILKHAHATQASISLAREQNHVQLTIADNGRGFFDNDSDGRGMKNVKARVDSLGGKWHIQNLPDGGMSSEIVVPVTS